MRKLKLRKVKELVKVMELVNERVCLTANCTAALKQLN